MFFFFFCFVLLVFFIYLFFFFFFFNDTATTEIYTLFPTRRSSDHDDAGNQHVSDVLTPERLAPRIGGRLSLRLDGLEDRRLLKLESDVDGDRDHEQRQEERDAPSPRCERLGPQHLPRHDDDDQGHHDPERRRRLEPAGVVAPFVVRRMLGDVRDGSAILAAQAQALDEAKEQKDNPLRWAVM